MEAEETDKSLEELKVTLRHLNRRIGGLAMYNLITEKYPELIEKLVEDYKEIFEEFDRRNK